MALHVFDHACKFVCIYVCMYACMHACTCTIHIHIYICICTCVKCLHVDYITFESILLESCAFRMQFFPSAQP